MMRDNSAARKLVLLMALLSVVGIAFGCVADDLLWAGGPFADDPAFPVPSGATAMAMPAKAPALSSIMGSASAAPIAVPARNVAPEQTAFASPAPLSAGFSLPQRC